MANFLFWNINKRPIENLITRLVSEYNADILVLAESEIDESRLLFKLNAGQGAFYYPTDNLSARLKMYSRYPKEYFVPIRDWGGISIRHLKLPMSDSILLVMAHLPSKLFQNEAEQIIHSTLVAEEIKKAEDIVGHSRIVIFGDLNMNPFEVGVISAAGLHGVMDRRIASRGSRRVEGKEYRFYYNPMWGKLGDGHLEPPGTYYYEGGKYNNFFWNMLDQVIISNELLDVFRNESIRIITNVGEKSLLKESGKPNTRVGSDHLPIFFQFMIGGVEK